MRYFAVEVLPDETPLKVVKEVIQAASTTKYSFLLIEAQDRIKIGSTEFQRFRMKDNPSRLFTILQSRGVIQLKGSDFEVTLKDGRKGKVPLTVMLATPTEKKMYRGPGDKYWERQFNS